MPAWELGVEAVGGVLITAGLTVMAAGAAGLLRGRAGWGPLAAPKMAALALAGGLVLAVGGCGPGTEEDQTAPADPTGPRESTTTTATTTAATVTTLKVESACAAPDDAAGFETPAREGVVPDVVCMDLQLAQDKAQAAGFYNLGSQDQTGQARSQVLDRDWVVVSQSPAAGTRADPDARVVFTVLAYGDPAAPPLPDRAAPGRMPRLVCFDLQEAQDTLQSAGFRVMTSEDATGAGRRQVVDRNWIVTDQTPAAGGTVAKTTPVVLGAVADGEPSSCR